VGLNRGVLAALVVGLMTAGAALGAGSQPAHPERDYAGSGLVSRLVSPVRVARPEGLPGLDVSSWQGNVDWATVAANGARFAYVKATEGTSYVNPYFTQQYGGAYAVGLVRGAYHFGLPDRSTGTAQAQWFAAHGGSWSADGQTLPGALDIEYNPYGATCYGLSQSAMVAWLTSFVTQYQALTTRSPVIYTTTNWWQTCTGNYAGLGATVPLWIACWCQTAGQLPAGWSNYAFWQWTNQQIDFPGDQDVFNGSQDDLVAFANGGQPPPPQPPPPPLPPPPPPPPPPPAVICRVPRVIGMRLANARTRIRRAHCSPGRVRHVRSKRVGRVLGQRPRAGSRRARGARVSLLVGRKRH
jgi:GH25 family lysozyme M1 (1,4-beta-N-acetylmuramidase)